MIPHQGTRSEAYHIYNHPQHRKLRVQAPIEKPRGGYNGPSMDADTSKIY